MIFCSGSNNGSSVTPRYETITQRKLFIFTLRAACLRRLWRKRVRKYDFFHCINKDVATKWGVKDGRELTHDIFGVDNYCFKFDDELKIKFSIVNVERIKNSSIINRLSCE